ncbi:MAG: hypothetical protein NC097_01435 [Clostridium sp.]|nr:hypothetical protein [Prevotella sp.]MCM1428443.1 hypothetical protein [Clostridium sp.]MCM1474908.1 hypothetical protein [Muribaculaceae bacterium]
MKKSLILMTVALGVAFTACDDDSDLGIMQVNQPPVVVASNGVATADLLGGSLDLNNYQNVNIPIMDIAMNSNFPAAAVISGTLQIATDDKFEHPQEIQYTSAVVDGANAASEGVENPVRAMQAYVEGNLVEEAFVKLYGNAPAAKELYMRYNMFIQDGSQANILEYNGQQWWPSRKVNVTPVDLKLDVYPAYTIYGPQIGNGTVAEGIAMMHGSDKHIYDDPVFSGVITVTEEQATAGFTFNICPTEKPSIVYGVVNGSDATAVSGRLVEGGDPLKIDKAGPYKIEVNMQTKVYTITLAYEQLWVPCTGNNSNFTRSCQTLTTKDYINYSGFAYISGFWALTTTNNFRDVCFMNGEGEGTLAQVAKNTSLNAANKVGIPQPGTSRGLYWIDANIVKLTYSATYIKDIFLSGTYNGWDTSKDVALTALPQNPTAFTIWEGDVTFSEPGAFKFRMNDNWDINLGGSLSDLTTGGENIAVDEAGTYHVRLDVSKHPWTATVVKK